MKKKLRFVERTQIQCTPLTSRHIIHFGLHHFILYYFFFLRTHSLFEEIAKLKKKKFTEGFKTFWFNSIFLLNLVWRR